MYATIGVAVQLVSTETLNIPSLQVVNVGRCAGSGFTQDQERLFQNRNSVSKNEVVAYLVRQTIPPLNGCATHPPGQPAIIFVRNSSKWTLGHEVGHVLGLGHVPSTDRLMTGGGTWNITNEPPDLTAQEGEVMRGSPYTIDVSVSAEIIEAGDANMGHNESISDDVAAFLESDEPDYDAGGRKFRGNNEAISKVEQVASDANARLITRTKAVYLLSLLDEQAFSRTANVLGSQENEDLKVAVASGALNISAQIAAPLLVKLLDDQDVGVRKASLMSIPGGMADSVTPEARELLSNKLRKVAESDPEAELRKIANERLQELSIQANDARNSR
ncbi:hypothetical protein [Methylobacterium sp. A52T]